MTAKAKVRGMHLALHVADEVDRRREHAADVEVQAGARLRGAGLQQVRQRCDLRHRARPERETGLYAVQHPSYSSKVSEHITRL